MHVRLFTRRGIERGEDFSEAGFCFSPRREKGVKNATRWKKEEGIRRRISFLARRREIGSSRERMETKGRENKITLERVICAFGFICSL